jgi:hypothetical protein
MQIDYLEPASGDYSPGVCNIGPREIAKRRAYGVAGIVATVVLGLVLVAIDAPQIARAIVLIPLWGAIISLEQARRKFCAAFAYAGIRSVNGSDATESVADAADLALDRASARRMVAYCGAIALGITALFVVLPV